MTRATELRFGTFGQKLGTPVYSEGWWLCAVADVRLEGTPAASEPLTEHLGVFRPNALLPLIQRGQDACWVRACLPIAFQCDLEASYTADTLIRIGFFAARVERNDADVAYPFLCVDQQGRTALRFSDFGPDEATRKSIGRAFWLCLLNAADYLTDFEATVIEPDTGVRRHYLCRDGRLSYEMGRD
jgi:hypothetical protein